jgi:hypothetical protein
LITSALTIAGPARAEDGPSATVGRALVGARLDRPLTVDGRRLGAQLVPSLKLSAAVARMDGRGGPWSITAWASLSWPLDRLHGDPAERVLSRRRAALAAEVAEIWRKREALRRRYEQEASADARLDLDEASAELDALTGEVAP